MNILVTGCGGDIGQSIGKILKNYPAAERVLGCDLHFEHAGIFIFDKCLLSKAAKSEGYITDLEAIIESEGVDLVVPSTEHELRIFAKLGILQLGKAKILRVSDRVLETCLDKYSTYQFLSDNGISVPETFVLPAASKVRFPCIIKSRTGSGSKSVVIVRDQEMFNIAEKWVDDPIYQELVGTPEGEYTCALFRSRKGIIRQIAFRRRLGGGLSVYGQVVNHSSIQKALVRVAEAFQLVGSINVQLRMGETPKIFEINPRFSSTVLFRHLLGFEDLIWSIEDTIGNEPGEYLTPPEGSSFYKGYNEYISRQ